MDNTVIQRKTIKLGFGDFPRKRKKQFKKWLKESFKYKWEKPIIDGSEFAIWEAMEYKTRVEQLKELEKKIK